MSLSDIHIKGVDSEMPVQGQFIRNDTTIVVESNDESTTKSSVKMIKVSAALCVFAMFLVMAAQYYLYLFLFYGNNSGDESAPAIVMFMVAGVACIVAIIIGMIYTRGLPDDSRQTCKKGIAIVGVIFFIAAAILFIIWVAQERDAAPGDNDDQDRNHEMGVFFGGLVQGIVLAIVVLILCIAFCCASCCKPPKVTFDGTQRH
eukprot:TRINITY_DN2472_c0_g1_i1.p1 TRINITY_DN2472_c0_g1~~TRINITY_DN2472_c0_g1_i1.p1  ORF type:complete len:203 (+),score=16.68 TRINITY_DN2472_c0_g1_i1:60-668(+)